LKAKKPIIDFTTEEIAMPSDLHTRPFKHYVFIAYSRKYLEFAVKL